MCLGNSPNPGTFSSLPGVKSVLPRRIFTYLPENIYGDHRMCYRRVFSGDVVYHLQKSYPYLLIFAPYQDFLDVYNVEQAGQT